MAAEKSKLKIVSLFTGAGGLDLGFKQAGFETVWANEYDKVIWETFEHNFPDVTLDKRSIVDIPSNDIPDCDGIIGGPPCQSWSEAGARRGIKDKRGRLFYEYIRILKDKKPLFFLAENVSGILAQRHSEALTDILNEFSNIGYDVQFQLLNACDFETPQDRKRLIIIGFRQDAKVNYTFPEASDKKLYLRDALEGLGESCPALEKNHTNGEIAPIPNHEHFIGGYSTIYMSRNRVRAWDEFSYTIQAGGRHAPIHPSAPKMVKVGKDAHIFQEGKKHLYRRLSVRECARIQTFPDHYKFIYKNLGDGYKMIGNAVPVTFAYHLANSLRNCLRHGLKNTEPRRSKQSSLFAANV